MFEDDLNADAVKRENGALGPESGWPTFLMTGAAAGFAGKLKI